MNAELEWVFAYGSNMSLKDLRDWFARKGYGEPRIARVERAILPDYRLVWNYYSTSRKGGAANVERADGGTLPGLALLVSANTREAIDAKEGHATYYCRGTSPVPVVLADGTPISAWLYVAVVSRCKPTAQPPTRAYLDLLISAAEEHGLPDDHVAMLKATPTADGEHA